MAARSATRMQVPSKVEAPTFSPCRGRSHALYAPTKQPQLPLRRSFCKHFSSWRFTTTSKKKVVHSLRLLQSGRGRFWCCSGGNQEDKGEEQAETRGKMLRGAVMRKQVKLNAELQVGIWRWVLLNDKLADNLPRKMCALTWTVCCERRTLGKSVVLLGKAVRR